MATRYGSDDTDEDGDGELFAPRGSTALHSSSSSGHRHPRTPTPTSTTRKNKLDGLRTEMTVMAILKEQLLRQEERISELTHHIDLLESERLAAGDFGHHAQRLLQDRVAQLEGALRKADNDAHFAERRWTQETALTASLRAEVDVFMREVVGARDEAARHRDDAKAMKAALDDAHVTIARLQVHCRVSPHTHPLPAALVPNRRLTHPLAPSDVLQDEARQAADTWRGTELRQVRTPPPTGLLYG
jgi:hypothetical protein